MDASEMPLASNGDTRAPADASEDNQAAGDSAAEVVELRRTVEDQRRSLEALTARLDLTAGSGAELRALLIERAREAEARLEQQATSARHSADEVAKRDSIIRDLQARLAEQTAWAQRMAADVVQRDTVIRDLQATLASTFGRQLPTRLYRAARRLARFR